MARRDCSGLRVLLVGTYPPPYGGIATHLVALIPGLKARGAEDVAVVTMGEEDRVQHLPGATVYRYAINRHLSLLLDPSNSPLVLRVLRCLGRERLKLRALMRESVKAVLVNRIAKRHSSDVVAFYHSNGHFELLPLASHWRRRRAIVLAVFGEVYDSPAFMEAHKPLMRRIIETPDEVWASSDHCARSFASIGIERPIRTVYIGVDVESENDESLRAHYRAEHGVGPDDIVVLFFGRFIRDMGLDVVLSMIPSAIAESDRVKFILAGAKGELSPEARQAAQAYPDRLIVSEDVPFSMQAVLYCACDMVIAPSFSHRACMGLSIKEAMAAGRPVVATHGGGIPEAVLHGVTGFLVPLDPKTHAADVQLCKDYVLSLVSDAALRARLGRAGRDRARELFSTDETSDRIARIFMSVRPASR